MGEYHVASSVEEALEKLSRCEGRAEIVAGGQTMMLLIRQGLVDPDLLVDISKITEIRGIENNALVFDGDNVSNVEGLRYYNEPVRHKILDCMGDIFMAGFRINGKVIAYKSGHELNNKLMHTLFSDNKNWSISPYKSSETFNFKNPLEPIAAIA